MQYIKFAASLIVCLGIVSVCPGDSISLRLSDNSSRMSGVIDGVSMNAHSDVSGNTIHTYGSAGGTSFSDTSRVSDDLKTVQETGNIGGVRYSATSRDIGDAVRTSGVVDGESFSDITRICNDAVYANGRVGNESYNFTFRESGKNAITIRGNFGGERIDETIRFSDCNIPSINVSMPDFKLSDFKMPDFNSSDFNFSGF